MLRAATEESTFELQQVPINMGFFRSRQQEYQPVPGDTRADGDDESAQDETEATTGFETPFSWIEYAIFLLLGIAMLWAWYGLLIPVREHHY
jgi:hypothetical protein